MTADQPGTLEESERFCRRLARSHYENFLVASILLPRRLRQPFYNIYAFCRTADDVADESPSPQEAMLGLEQLQSGIDGLFQRSPPSEGLFPALTDTVARFGIDQKPFDDLLSAFRQDQTVRRYDSMPQLQDYCTRSANPVGRMVLQLADSLNEETARLSDEICTGLQLANFWQDVARDLEIGRIYLPADLRRQYGVTEAMLTGPETAQPLKQLLAKLCDDAESRFQRGLPLAERVPSWLSADIKLFAHGGISTLQAIRAIDFDVLKTRPRVGKWRQMTLVGKALLHLL